VRRLLAESKCPVVLAPRTFTEPKNIVFAYDGSDASLFAIKQFSYLFPQMRDKPLFVVEVTDDGIIRENGKLREWLSGKYIHVAYEVLRGEPSARLLEVAMSTQGAILVFGAFGRNAISRFFKPGTADSILKLAASPMFIAHH
jgi:nucleotide-binding universal stress UspA family protein